MASIWRRDAFKYDMCTTARHVAVEYRIVRYTSIEVLDRQQSHLASGCRSEFSHEIGNMMMPTSRLPLARDIGKVCLNVRW